MGRRHLGAVQDVQALLGILGRHLRPAGDLVARRHQGARRGAQPVSPQHRHRADDPGAMVGEFMKTMMEYPPRQSPDSWTPEKMMESMRQKAEALKTGAHGG